MPFRWTIRFALEFSVFAKARPLHPGVLRIRRARNFIADLLRPRELRTLAILLRPRTDDLFARSRPGTPKKVMGPPEEGTLADLLAPEGRRGTLAGLLRIY